MNKIDYKNVFEGSLLIVNPKFMRKYESHLLRLYITDKL